MIKQVLDMRSTELRIGNLVLAEDKIYKATISTIQDPEDFDPIPLTEEWLLKFNFDPKPEYGSTNYSRYNCPIYVMNTGKNKGVVFANGIIEDIRLDYVHQLQNLFFAVTGKELELVKENG